MAFWYVCLILSCRSYPDKPVEQLAQDLGISQSSLNRWRREYRADPDQAFPGQGHLKERDEEVAQLKAEKDIINAINQLFGETSAVFPIIRTQCLLLLTCEN